MVVVKQFKFDRYFFLALLFCLLSACNTLSSSADDQFVETPPEQKKLNAAKINVRLGMAYLERQDLRRAKLKLLLALEEAPKLPEAWYTMAYFLEKTGDPDKANTYYLKAMKLAPGRGDALNNYGTYLCRNQKYQGAINYFLRAAKDPAYLDPGAAYENAGLCALKIPDNSLAMRYFRLAIQQDSSRPTSLLELAELSFQANKFQDARNHLRQHLAIAPASAASLSLEKRLQEQA